MPQERLPKQALLAKVKGKRPVGRPRWWRTVMFGDSILNCCPRNLHGHERALKEEEEDIVTHFGG